MPEPHIQFYSTAELEEFANIILSKFYHTEDVLPVEVDLIAEKYLGIDIIDFIGLKEHYGLEAFLALGKKTIYVDQFLMDAEAYLNRYRFTIAEEIGHRMLHSDLFKSVESVEEYFEALDKVKHFQMAKMDKDAKYLAAAILMPTTTFTKLTTDYITELDYAGNILRYAVVDKLSKNFIVSFDSASIRFDQLGLNRLIPKE